ncbi:M48 family metallopeptidase [Salipaludibacillus daqingensis]|uniref:M48 family metallopeptidase n=1 Tax=Salipaludibacillus daqingensis TaxID=3041001 RepID=UPI002475B4AA|nr:SprT family zinc-dependent metalloprotease [Salipaludibacillus daqingensis]
MPCFVFGKTTIDYQLEYSSDSKDILITVEWLNGVKVTAPRDTNEQQLQKLLHKKAPWILTKWKAFNEIIDKPAPKEFVSGEKFTYLGRNYRLKVHKKEEINNVRLAFNRGKFISEVPAHFSEEEKNEEFSTAFKKWYNTQGEKKLNERLAIYTEKMNIVPEKVKLKEQKMRWGTCTPNGSLYLNWRIIMAPIPIVDYLLVHELAHLKHPNHSKEFWRLVRSIIPDYEQRKEWLRVNGPRLTIEHKSPHMTT